MGALCRCLFQHCCNSRAGDNDSDNDDDNNTTHDRTFHRTAQLQSYSSVSEYIHPIEGQGLISARGESQLPINNVGVTTSSSSVLTTLTSATVTEEGDDDDVNNNRTDCCRPSSSNVNNNPSSLFSIIRRQMNRWHNNNNDDDAYNVIPGRNDEGSHNYDIVRKTKSFPINNSPLRQAISFNTILDSDVPCTINNDEIVLPGSMIQQQMAEQMIKLSHLNSTNNSNIEECVICMEPFDSTNPRMPTLCNCGINKTYFHLPCLYQWIEQCLECPSCRTKLTWEEF